MSRLIDQCVASWPQELKDKQTYTVALSGGIDSVVLLFIFYKIKSSLAINLSAIHINHGISSNAILWEGFCVKLCRDLEIPIKVVRHSLSRLGGESLENNARMVRYRDFCALDSEVILLGHHKNDQIETMLSQILRGSNLHNIASMRVVSKKNNKLFWRPLLEVTRKEIESFALEHSLVNINDESNLDISYLRNFIRHKLLPDIISWDNSVCFKLIQSLNSIQDAIVLVDDLAKIDLAHLAINSDFLILDLERFKLLSKIRQINALGYLIKQHNLPLPSKKQLQEFCHQALSSAWDRYPELNIRSNYKLIKFKQQIILQL